MYSITETALLNGLKPYNYLTYVMEKIERSRRVSGKGRNAGASSPMVFQSA
ncbi:MAG: transposase domain-containing protein [Enterocloster clostridioformis]